MGILEQECAMTRTDDPSQVTVVFTAQVPVEASWRPGR